MTKYKSIAERFFLRNNPRCHHRFNDSEMLKEKETSSPNDERPRSPTGKSMNLVCTLTPFCITLRSASAVGKKS